MVAVGCINIPKHLFFPEVAGLLMISLIVSQKKSIMHTLIGSVGFKGISSEVVIPSIVLLRVLLEKSFSIAFRDLRIKHERHVITKSLLGSAPMNQQKPNNILQSIDLNARTNRRYTILGSGITGSNKDRLSIGPNGDQRRRASVVPKAQPTPSRRVSMMPSATTSKSPGRNLPSNKSRLSMIGSSST